MVSIIQTSLSAGEISPTMFGRVDLAKYHVGLAKARNFFVDYRGGATSRAGTKLVARGKSADPRLFTFQFSAEQSYLMEFGANYIRLHSQGAPVLETPFNLDAITRGASTTVNVPGHNYVVGDWVYISDVLGTTQINMRTFTISAITLDTLTLTDYSGVAINSASWGVYLSGGTVSRVYTIATPYAEADLPELRFSQSQDVVTLTHQNYRARNLLRYGATNWVLQVIDYDAQIDPPAGVVLTGATPSGTAAENAYFSYCVTAVDGATGEESVASSVVTANCLNISATAGSNLVSWNRREGAAYYNVYKAQVSPGQTIPVGSTYGYCGTAYGLELVDGNIVPDFTKVPPTRRDPFAPGQITKVTPVVAGATYVAGSTTATITDPTGTGAEIAPIVTGGGVTAFLVLKPGKNYSSPTVVIVGGDSNATATATVGATSGTDPAVSCYFQQRQIFGSSINQPKTLWGSRPGAFTNMDISIPTLPDDALTLTLASSQSNDIKALQPMPGGLVVLTSGGAWQISGGGNGEPISASSVVATPQAFNGANDIPPITINFEILYVQAQGSTVRNLSYNFFANIYTGTDLSVLSNHLFTGYTVKNWAWAEEPFKLLWIVRDDGKLLTLTFLKEQEVAGWAWADTQGLFKSVTTVQEGEEDVPYFAVKRYIGGEWVTFIEQMQPRYFQWDLAEEAWCLDCALELPQTFPEADIAISAPTGAVTVTATNAVFTAGCVGKVLRAGGGIIDVTGYTSASVVTGTVRSPIQDTLNDTTILRPFPSGDWSFSRPVTTLTGLEHLEGEAVSVVADGSYIGEFTVTDASITIPQSASKIIAGLKYTCQLQTLPIDTGQPTIQGRRKKIVALTMIVDKTRGLSVGHTFSDLYEVKELSSTVPLGSPVPLMSTRQRINIPPAWSVEGQLCIQQNYPMPATVLAIIPEVSPGDVDK